jgi:hypothetical protein
LICRSGGGNRWRCEDWKIKPGGKKNGRFGNSHGVEHQPKTKSPSDDFLTKEELKDRLNLPSTRMVDEMMKKRKIPFQKLGHRTIRFNWEKVKAALEKFEHKAVGQK